MIARRAQPGLLASAAIVRALWLFGAAPPRIRASRASVASTPLASELLVAELLEPRSEQLCRVIKVLSRTLRGLPAHVRVLGLVDGEFRPCCVDDSARIQCCGMLRGAGDVC